MKSKSSNAGTGEFGRLTNAYKGTTQSLIVGRAFASSSGIHVPKNLQKSNLDYGKSNGSANINQSNLNIGEPMTIPREELDAKLAQNKAEVQAIASGMREEMAAWRETQNAQMVQMNATLTSMAAKMDAKFDALDTKIESLDTKIDSVDKSLGGRIDGLNMAVSGIQSGISIRLAVFSVFIAVLLAVASWWVSSNQQPTQHQQPQPTVIYVQQPPAQQSK
ncbi:MULTISPECIES: hypothetical protein [unclassified Providencia]|uniref:hypothetical protein n=1 Tax=unclassified Providencia TaxID=2633465 RepID=UPI00234B392A|nr:MULTISPECIES: hypothetical protein [unclassified Providencia]